MRFDPYLWFIFNSPIWLWHQICIFIVKKTITGFISWKERARVLCWSDDDDPIRERRSGHLIRCSKKEDTVDCHEELNVGLTLHQGYSPVRTADMNRKAGASRLRGNSDADWNDHAQPGAHHWFTGYGDQEPRRQRVDLVPMSPQILLVNASGTCGKRSCPAAKHLFPSLFVHSGVDAVRIMGTE